MMTINRALIIVVGIALLVIVVQQSRIGVAERRTLRVGLAQDSLGAVHDTTRLVNGDDSTRVWEERALQATQRADALDRALRHERVARADVHIGTPTLDTLVTVPAPGDTEVIRETPYTLSIEARPKGSPDTAGSIDLHVAADTLTLGVRIGCGPTGPLGVQPASVSVSAPRWASVRLDHVEQDPAVCNAKTVSAASRTGMIRSLLHRVGLTVGYAAVVSGGVVIARPSLGIGLTIWP